MDAIAESRDPRLVEKIYMALDDQKDIVRYAGGDDRQAYYARQKRKP